MGKVLESLVWIVVVAEPAGAFREHIYQASKEEGWDDLNGKRNSPFATVTGADPGDVAAVSCPSCEDLSQGIKELLETRDLASDATMADLGLVNGDNHLSL